MGTTRLAGVGGGGAGELACWARLAGGRTGGGGGGGERASLTGNAGSAQGEVALGACFAITATTHLGVARVASGIGRVGKGAEGAGIEGASAVAGERVNAVVAGAPVLAGGGAAQVGVKLTEVANVVGETVAREGGRDAGRGPVVEAEVLAVGTSSN